MVTPNDPTLMVSSKPYIYIYIYFFFLLLHCAAGATFFYPIRNKTSTNQTYSHTLSRVSCLLRVFALRLFSHGSHHGIGL